MKVTNKAAGPRGFNALSPDGTAFEIMLQPGQSVEADVVAHPALAGHVRSGDLVFGEAADDKATAEADAMLAEVEAKKQAEAAEKEAADVKARNELADQIMADAEKRTSASQQAETDQAQAARGGKRGKAADPTV